MIEKIRAETKSTAPTIKKTPPNEKAIKTYPLKIGPIVCPISMIVLRVPIAVPISSLFEISDTYAAVEDITMAIPIPKPQSIKITPK